MLEMISAYPFWSAVFFIFVGIALCLWFQWVIKDDPELDALDENVQTRKNLK